eukprot:scaffold2711_cov131-Chaetoceros_neogracile.AAC.1
MAKKSAAQIRRMEQRASERGTTYEAPPASASDPASALAPTTNKNEESNSSKKDSDSSKVNAKYQAALKLKQAIDAIETNTANLNSKDKRSAKRKAEAIALEI